MTRLALAIVAATALSGCQHSGQQAIDPFWGRTTVPSPATGSIGAPIPNPVYSQPLQSPAISLGTPIPNSTLQPTPQPNLLPAPTSSSPIAPGAPATMPGTAGSGGNGDRYGNGAPAVTSPPSGYSPPGVAPPSGYSNPSSSPWGTSGSPAVTAPGSTPAGSYPVAPASPGSFGPAPSGATPMGPNSGSPSPAGPAATPAPSGSSPSGAPASGAPPGYFPDGGFKYQGSMRGPSARGQEMSPGYVPVTPVSLDGATVSAPPETTAGNGLDAGPSIIRIPTAAGGDSTATQASAEVPAP